MRFIRYESENGYRSCDQYSYDIVDDSVSDDVLDEQANEIGNEAQAGYEYLADEDVEVDDDDPNYEEEVEWAYDRYWEQVSCGWTELSMEDWLDETDWSVADIRQQMIELGQEDLARIVLEDNLQGDDYDYGATEDERIAELLNAAGCQ